MSNQYPPNAPYGYGRAQPRPPPQQYNQPPGYPPYAGQQPMDRSSYGPPHPQYPPNRSSIPQNIYQDQPWPPPNHYPDARDVRQLDDSYSYAGQAHLAQNNVRNPPPSQLQGNPSLPHAGYDPQYIQNGQLHQSAPMHHGQKIDYDYTINAPSRSSNNSSAPSMPPQSVPRPNFDFDEANDRSRAEYAFNYFDRDQSGHLDFQEFQEALRYLNLAILFDDARRKFYEADLDGNQRISKREFVDMYIQERRNYYQYNQYQPQ